MGRGKIFFFLFALIAVAGCSSRRPPLVFVEQVGQMPAESFPRDCSLPFLTSPPERPHRVIARLKAYSNSDDRVADMQEQILRQGCTIGAQAIILQPLEHGEYRAEGAYTFPKYQSYEYREVKVKAERSVMLVGLAIVYQEPSSPPPPLPLQKPLLVDPPARP
jgi:hypothetical protein